uniref:Uncharacterized protein n=1 Tax=Hemiselmis tepida TaxID=464990 RepID=A0A7S0Z1W4_9CRYP|mmetsp:Transcript_8622/g.22438  ORF Transcript_8622/g.22438 Transcript_8622/m.22438 type:complete len:332 (+) Transcript_8622:583-1578(+)
MVVGAKVQVGRNPAEKSTFEEHIEAAEVKATFEEQMKEYRDIFKRNAEPDIRKTYIQGMLRDPEGSPRLPATPTRRAASQVSSTQSAAPSFLSLDGLSGAARQASSRTHSAASSPASPGVLSAASTPIKGNGGRGIGLGARAALGRNVHRLWLEGSSSPSSSASSSMELAAGMEPEGVGANELGRLPSRGGGSRRGSPVRVRPLPGGDDGARPPEGRRRSAIGGAVEQAPPEAGPGGWAVRSVSSPAGYAVRCASSPVAGANPLVPEKHERSGSGVGDKSRPLPRGGEVAGPLGESPRSIRKDALPPAARGGKLLPSLGGGERVESWRKSG